MMIAEFADNLGAYVRPADDASRMAYMALQNAINSAAKALKLSDAITPDAIIGEQTLALAQKVIATAKLSVDNLPAEVSAFLADFTGYLKASPVKPVTAFYESLAKPRKSSALYWIVGGVAAAAAGAGTYWYIRRRRRTAAVSA